MVKRRKFVFPLLLVSGLALWFFFLRDDGISENPVAANGNPGIEWQFAPVRRGNVEETVTAQGKLEPREYVDVGAQVSGQLKKIYVEIGDTVKKGDLIAEIDPRVYQSRVEASEARLKTLRAQLSEQEAQITFASQQNNRNTRLMKAKAVSQETLEDSQTALKVAQSRAASLRAQIEESQSSLEGDTTNLSYTKIYAPFDGTVVLQPTREGQTVNASQTAPIIVQLADLDIMTVKSQVAEADVMRLREGMEVEFSTLGNLERRWKATVRQILPSPEVVNDVVLYNALIDVQNEDRQLMTGMSTQVFFNLGSAKDALLIPTLALGQKLSAAEDGSQKYKIRVKDGEQTAEKTITVGLVGRNEVEVLNGLAEGEEVALPVAPATGAKEGGRPRIPSI